MPKKKSIAIIIYNKKILLLLRDNNPNIQNPNAWQLPGGRIEKSENHFQTIKRELKEEISLIPVNLQYLGDAFEDISVYVSFLTDDEVKRIKLGNEGQELKFFTKEELVHLTVTPSIKLYMEKYGDALDALINGEIPEDVSLLGLKR